MTSCPVNSLINTAVHEGISIMIIMYIYNALSDTLNAHMIHINPKTNILYTRRAQSYWYSLHKASPEEEKIRKS